MYLLFYSRLLPLTPLGKPALQQGVTCLTSCNTSQSSTARVRSDGHRLEWLKLGEWRPCTKTFHCTYLGWSFDPGAQDSKWILESFERQPNKATPPLTRASETPSATFARTRNYAVRCSTTSPVMDRRCLLRHGHILGASEGWLVADTNHHTLFQEG